MRKRWWIILIIALIAGGAIIGAFRWRAWFGNPPEPQWTGDTINYHFYTFGDEVVPGFEKQNGYWQDKVAPDTLQILLFGDIHNALTHEDYNAVIARYPHLDAYAQLGDWVERGYFYYRQKLYSELSGTRFDKIPVMACPGNHEYHKGVKPVLPDYWCNDFRNPLNGPSDFLGTTYYVDFPTMRMVVINTNGLQYLHDYTRMSAWLDTTIDGAKDKFVVVMMHHPVYSCGSGRQNVPIMLSLRRELSGADLVFAGHDHNYSRRLPFVDTNAATKFYLSKINTQDERIGCGIQVYELLSVVGDTLTMETRLLHSGQLYDRVQIIRHGNKREVVDMAINAPEIILLPENYEGQNSLRVRRFINRRNHRLSEMGVSIE